MALLVSTALSNKIIANVTLAPIAGSLAQYPPRSTFLIGFELAGACLVRSLPSVTEAWQVYPLILPPQARSAEFTPTLQPTISDVLTEDAEYAKGLRLWRLACALENRIARCSPRSR